LRAAMLQIGCCRLPAADVASSHTAAAAAVAEPGAETRMASGDVAEICDSSRNIATAAAAGASAALPAVAGKGSAAWRRQRNPSASEGAQRYMTISMKKKWHTLGWHIAPLLRCFAGPKSTHTSAHPAGDSNWPNAAFAAFAAALGCDPSVPTAIPPVHSPSKSHLTNICVLLRTS
jgi:hypothetical protein